VKPVPCDLPGQCFKAVFDGGLTIRGCPLGPEANLQGKICDRIPAMMKESGGSLASKFNNAATQNHFKASCGGGGAAPQVLLCRGRACNGASGLAPSKLGVASFLFAAILRLIRWT